MRIVLRPLVGLAVVAVIAGCAAPAASSSPVASAAAATPPPDAAATAPPSPKASAPASPEASPESSPTAGLRLIPAGPEAAFALIDPPFAEGSSLAMGTVAAGPGGWVAGGAYEPVTSGELDSDADAPLWFSADGRDWERVGVGDPDLGGPGEQWVSDAVSTTTGWWALGWSGEASDPSLPAPRLWSSLDGRTWDTVALDPCRLDVCPDALEATAALRALPDGSLLLVGTAQAGDASTPGWWRLEGGAITAGGVLPRAGDIPVGQGIVSLAVSDGDDGWVILATVAGNEGSRVLAWTSPDGAAWSQVTDGRTEGLEALEVLWDVEIAGDRWIVAGEPGLALVDDNGPAFLDETSSLFDVVRVADGYVAAGSADPMTTDAPLALWSADGAAWSAIPIEAASPRESTGAIHGVAFDGETLVAVGGRGVVAMAWSSGD